MTTAIKEIKGLTTATARSIIEEGGRSMIIGSMAGLRCRCRLINLVWEFSVEFWCGKKFWCGKTIFGGCTCYPNFGGETILI